MGDMKFFVENQRIEKEVEWVRNQVRLHMNGATTSQMEQGGIHYRVNYGVAVPHLMQLAKRIPVSYELAERLWFLEIRETMLLAAILVPAEAMTIARCNEWASKINNKDLVERSAMYLWGRLDVLDNLLNEWLASPNEYLKATTLYTIGRQGRLLEEGQFNADRVIDVMDQSHNRLVLSAGAYALRMLMRSRSGEIEAVKSYVQRLKTTDESCRVAIAEELISEVEFLEG
jgi:3-methyladenine DNA glycosylase AlkD